MIEYNKTNYSSTSVDILLHFMYNYEKDLMKGCIKMSLFNKNASQTKPSSPMEMLEAKYKNSVQNILLVVIFTVINSVLLLINANSYFLFSAYIPYFSIDMGMYCCGLYPQEYYFGDEEFFGTGFLAFTVAIAAVIVVLYLLCWLFGKKKKIGWVIFAMVLFAADTAFLLLNTGLSSEYILDIVFHAWVLFSIGNCISIYFKMKKLPAETPATPMQEAEMEGNEYSIPNSNVLRMADLDAKARVFLEADEAGCHIVYRRVGKTNELVINGRVYDEYTALMEMPHNLVAFINSRRIEAGCNASSCMYILVDGNQIASKMRII